MSRRGYQGDPMAAELPPFPDGVDDQLGYGVCRRRSRAIVGGESPWWNPHNYGVQPVNLCDFDELWKYRHLVSEEMMFLTELLKSIDYRIDQWPQRFDRAKHMYRENACLIAASEYSKRLNFCRCSRLGKPGNYGYATGRCRIWRLCPYCSHKKRLELLRKYLPVFKAGKWWFLTISPEEFGHVHSTNIDALISWWEACRFALQQLIDGGLIDGALVFETLSVHHYWPDALGLPHVHVVILAGRMTKDTTSLLTEILASYMGESWDSQSKQWAPRMEVYPDVDDQPILAPEPLWATASTRTYPIPEQHDMAAVVSYLCNPVNFAEAYVQEWPQVNGDARNSSFFNENAIEAIICWEHAIDQRWGHRYMGALHHSRNDFAGVKKAQRETEAHIAMVNLRLKLCGIEQSEGDPCEHLGTAIEDQEEDELNQPEESVL